jgi:essential nuclear protein 1
MPRTQKQTQKPRHDPLHVQLNEDEVEAKYGRISHPEKRKKSHKKDDDETGDVRPISFAYFSRLMTISIRSF